jgi:subtilisin family serine protease
LHVLGDTMLLHLSTLRSVSVALVETVALPIPGYAQSQDPVGFERASGNFTIVPASLGTALHLDLQNPASFATSLEHLLQQRLATDDLEQIMRIVRAPDTGATASTYAELVSLLPTSAATTARLFQSISAAERVSESRLQQDLVARIFDITGPSVRMSTQAAAAAGVGGAASTAAVAGAGVAGASVALAVAGVGLALASGSSSQSSAPSSSTCGTTCDAFGTEYDAQYGLALLNIKNKNDAGFTGSGVRVGVVDSGIFAGHSEFSSRTIGGVNYSGSGTFDSDENGHGTHVASTIGANRNALGMRGVAYEVDLFSYKIFDGSGSSSGLTDAVLAGLYNQHVTDNINISNNSWGSSTPITGTNLANLNAASPLTLAAFAAAQANGTIFVWASGNDSASEVSVEAGIPYFVTSLAPQWLAVTALDSTKTEASFANRCGVAWDTCVTAPGVSVNAAWNTGANNYATISGTSMAAPHVAGLLALLTEEFPALTPTQIVTRMKSTASYDGLTGRSGCTSASCTVAQMREIFGHGLVNQQAATAAVGSLGYTTSSNIYAGGSVAITAGAMAMPAGLNGAAVKAIQEASLVAFDSFDGAAFAVSGNDVFGTSSSGVASSVGYATFDSNVAGSDRYHSLTVLSDGSQGTPAIFMSQNSSPIDVASTTVWGDKAAFLPTPAFIKTEQVQRFEMVASNSGYGLRIIPYVQLTQSQSKLRTGGFGANFVYDMGEDTKIVASVGRSNAAFAFDIYGSTEGQRAALNSVEVGFSQKINNAWGVFGRVSRGYTSGFQASTTNWGLNDASFSRAGLGVEYKATSGAQFAFGVVNEGNFDAGQVSLVTATGRQINGTVNYTNLAFDASSSAEFAPFFTAKVPVSLSSNFGGLMAFSLQQSKFGGPISKADLSLSVRF